MTIGTTEKSVGNNPGNPQTMTDESQSERDRFIEAIKEDGYAEWEVSDGVHLITDTEFDGTFLPVVVADNPDEYDVQDIDDILHDAGAWDVFQWRHIEWSDSNNCWYPTVRACEHENVDPDVWN